MCFPEALIQTRWLQPEVIGLEQVTGFSIHEQRAQAIKMISMIGFAVAWSRSFEYAACGPVQRSRWIAILHRISDIAPADACSRGIYPHDSSKTTIDQKDEHAMRGEHVAEPFCEDLDAINVTKHVHAREVAFHENSKGLHHSFHVFFSCKEGFQDGDAQKCDFPCLANAGTHDRSQQKKGLCTDLHSVPNTDASGVPKLQPCMIIPQPFSRDMNDHANASDPIKATAISKMQWLHSTSTLRKPDM